MKKYLQLIFAFFLLPFGEGSGWAAYAQEKTCQQLLDDARQQYNTRDFDACIKTCKTIIATCKDFDFNQTNLYLVSSYIEKNEKDSAAIFLKKAVKQKPYFIYYKETETDEFQLLCKQYRLTPKLTIRISCGFHIPMQKITTYNSVFAANTIYHNTVWDINNLQLFSAQVGYRLNSIVRPYLQYSYFQNNFDKTINLNYEPVQKYIDEKETQKVSLTTLYLESIPYTFGKQQRDGWKSSFSASIAIGFGYAFCKSTIKRDYFDNNSSSKVVDEFQLQLNQKGKFAFPLRIRLSIPLNKINLFADMTYINFKDLGSAKTDNDLSLNYNRYYTQDERKITDLQFQIGVSYSTFSLRKK